MKSSTPTIIDSLRTLARDIESDDGVANMAIAEAADRLEEMQKQVEEMKNYKSVLLYLLYQSGHKDGTIGEAEMALIEKTLSLP